MKLYRTLLILFVISATIVLGCKKEDEPTATDPSPTPSTTSVFEQFFTDNIAAATQNFTVDASAGGQVIAAQGTKLDFEPNAFIHGDGSPVTGPVEVYVVEALSIGDMIWLNKQTVGNDNGTLKMLRSGGAFNIYANQGGNALRVSQGGLIVKIPTDIGDPDMELFWGNENPNGNMIWEPADTSSVTIESDYFNIYYVLMTDSLTWTNCDGFVSYPNLVSVHASIPSGQSSDSTHVWIAFPSENAVVNMENAGAQSYSIAQPAPLGMQAVIIGLLQGPTGYYSSFTTVNIAAGMVVPITFSPTTFAQFQADIDAI